MAKKQTETHLKQVLATISLESIISGFQAYRKTFKRVLQLRHRYANQELLPWQPNLLPSAISTFLYGVAICFLIYMPLTQKHGFELGKIYFLLQFAYSQLLLVCAIHLSAKVFRGRGTLSQTATAYCVWSGIMWPIAFIACYPTLIYIPIEDFIFLESAITDNAVLSLPSWIKWWNMGLFLIMVLIGFLTLFQWLADVHQITKRRLLLAMILVYTPIFIIHNIFVAPYLSKGIRLASDFLKLLL